MGLWLWRTAESERAESRRVYRLVCVYLLSGEVQIHPEGTDLVQNSYCDYREVHRECKKALLIPNIGKGGYHTRKVGNDYVCVVKTFVEH